jgi:hypothetical protein
VSRPAENQAITAKRKSAAFRNIKGLEPSKRILAVGFLVKKASSIATRNAMTRESVNVLGGERFADHVKHKNSHKQFPFPSTGIFFQSIGKLCTKVTTFFKSFNITIALKVLILQNI